MGGGKSDYKDCQLPKLQFFFSKMNIRDLKLFQNFSPQNPGEWLGRWMGEGVKLLERLLTAIKK